MEDNLHKELDALSPLLRDMKQHRRHQNKALPKDYFLTMQKSVLEQVKEDKSVATVVKQTAKKSWWQVFVKQLETYIQPRYAFAFASFGAVLLAFWWWTSTKEIADNCDTLACVPDEEIENYINQNIDDIPTEDIWDTLQAPLSVTEEKKDVLPSDKPQNHNPKHLKDATEEEIDELLEQMIQNNEIPTEDIEELL